MDPDRLHAYRAKRDAARTPEPVPEAAPETAPEAKPRTRRGRKPIFVVQEHRATALHWDFRLERDGVLVSWALPKGVPTDPKRNHRAVHTEDHPVEYADFTGRIPAGEYGAGTVATYDRGTYVVEKWTDDEVKVELTGERLSGHYTLFRTGGSDWMIHREKGQDPDFAAVPDDLRPMLAIPGTAPAGAGWACEFKWDGIRALCRVEGGRARLRSRNGNDLSETYPELKALAKTVSSAQLLLDGEIIALDEDGKVSFGALQTRFGTSGSEAARLSRTNPASYLVFDLLHLDGRSTLDLPYKDRRELLESLELSGPHWQTPPSFPDTPVADVLEAARAAGLEGVVAKRLDSTYQPGTRSPAWRKVKLTESQSAVIGGFTPLKSQGAATGRAARGSQIGALLLGVPDEAGRLRYVGKVGSGFTEQDRRVLLEALSELAVAESPFATAVDAVDARVATWVEPVVVAEVTFGEWTSKGRLRHPVFKGIRTDKDAAEVVRES
ncbi:DNA polymerase LigD, ligase domain protein [Catenulispora acidiphila DSM 44928]|uniref:DNA ligase (ATP) n=1 Tax=Catenulispora acidiphila (strain DSM 44928 / JCM 14897 / NBRC 102108 / NRRL B-24433 / ID139908) TaxID=479433 RepID=C7Q6S2_CATAD|nr:non-homologous end-joining DNA ligase [Catenulispora acidiphila]ACU74107.1 DNA polymerase LigD, ligase domain protein [Catenulispora acidiphila DSM 44928]